MLLLLINMNGLWELPEIAVLLTADCPCPCPVSPVHFHIFMAFGKFVTHMAFPFNHSAQGAHPHDTISQASISGNSASPGPRSVNILKAEIAELSHGMDNG